MVGECAARHQRGIPALATGNLQRRSVACSSLCRTASTDCISQLAMPAALASTMRRAIEEPGPYGRRLVDGISTAVSQLTTSASRHLDLLPRSPRGSGSEGWQRDDDWPFSALASHPFRRLRRNQIQCVSYVRAYSRVRFDAARPIQLLVHCRSPDQHGSPRQLARLVCSAPSFGRFRW